VDIVIGTHRLLQKDVKYKDLGLFIVDEEERFAEPPAQAKALLDLRRADAVDLSTPCELV
jgi:transcription-repair coupling factor (superfamily II helicase)